MSGIWNSMKRINFNLYFALLFLGLCPAIYSTVRIYFLGQMPQEWAYSIAGQLSWVNLLYEVLNEAVLLPLFFFMGKVVNNHIEFTNRIRSGLLVTFVLYSCLSVLIMLFVNPLLTLMATDASIVNESASYIRIESVANVFVMLSSFVLTALITLNRTKYIYTLTLIRLVCNIVLDSLFISSLPCSLALGVNGIGYSNIVVNLVILMISIALLKKEGIRLFTKNKISYSWMREFFEVGSISGLEAFVRNIAYMLMIVRMVNVVNEQGTYWVANGFIWGWLLLPVLQLGELIKQEVAINHENLKYHTKGYFMVTTIICLL